MGTDESNSNSFGPGNVSQAAGASTNDGPDSVRHGWFCCCSWCLQGVA